ncbi:MAG: threonine synthase [Coriobacteriia bacterium]|nr:threonine synthase [Coriobacteriia bacterium]MCL2870351.1 threonine synthase [Coriobacteriia bacterium]
MTLKFIDTRGLDSSRPTFSEVLLRGIADGGGLYLPENLPTFSMDQMDTLHSANYAQRGAFIYDAFGIDIKAADTLRMMQKAYGNQFDDHRIAPVVSLDEDTHMLELWHGPTSAFKDMALQCMPRFFSFSLKRGLANGSLSRDLLILVATSGDTGSAALAGFAHRSHTNLIVFYPDGGVSDVQRTQMTSSLGMNVGVYGVKGNFDDCQRAVKEAFFNEDLQKWLKDHTDLQLSSANSINWGRLMPQIIYYFSAIIDLRAAGKLADGQLLDIAVPTGNFGNIMAGWLAKQMGAPIGRLICASNENNVLADFINTGVYDIRGRDFYMTASPAMDILVSSNLERLLYFLAGPERTRKWMKQLREEGVFEVDAGTLSLIQQDFAADYVDNATSLSVIQDCWKRYHYLIEPHTAIALHAAEKHRGEGNTNKDKANPMMIVSTAHWAKFGPNVLRGLLGIPHDEELTTPYNEMTGFELLRAIRRLAPEAAHVPNRLSSLEGACERYQKVIPATEGCINSQIARWVEARTETH